MTTTIRSLFDPRKGLDRPIEKVITFAATQQDRLKAEISEYVVTESIENQFERLLSRMQLAMESGGENEIGVWVSGFYGSGKSSFTKYLGFAFDADQDIEQTPFLRYLQDRLTKPQTKALLGTVAQRFPAAVVMLDLASEMLAGATMEDVSSVLYYKVLEWAGYSRNLKVAALEQRIEKDEREAEFHDRLAALLPDISWNELRNDPLSIDALVPQLAHEMYPALFPSESSFNTGTEDYVLFETDRVQEMLDIIRRKSGKEHILFIIDEVGQYIASRDNLILNLDGLAKNLKGRGEGKVWIVSTAQQTLTEDDPRATLNSDKLYKLKDRFPIQIDLESSDIKEICYRRLLSKSPSGEATLGALFDTHGQALRHNTKLREAKTYEADFDKTTFVNLYPFMPAHFEILLNLLGALAKSTGGLGLRSAIKVVQDTLIEEIKGEQPVADRPLGWLATTVTLYDMLDKDIQRAFPSVYGAAQKTCDIYREDPLHQEVAKSIAVLQILGNLPVTVENLASLMHSAVDADSLVGEVRQAVEAMLQDPLVPLSEKEGGLGFLSEKLRDIERERTQLPPRSVEVRKIINTSLREIFDPLPKATLPGSFSVRAGLKVMTGQNIQSLAGEKDPVQLLVNFAEATAYEGDRTTFVEESRQRQAQDTIYAIGRTHPNVQMLAEEVYRCQRIEELYRNDPDQEVRDYCKNQKLRADRRSGEVKQLLQQSLKEGSFIFRGQPTAVSTLGSTLLEAARQQLGEVAEQVFDRYSEAPVRAETSLAEKFLKQPNLSAIASVLDPLDLIQKVGGKPQIQTSQKAVVSIRDYIDRNGTVEGKRLSDHFGAPPYGWSPDTLRYILAAMLVAGEITLKISGREVKTAGQKAIEALKTNKSFSKVGVGLRDYRPPIEVLDRASERLTELTGESVIPLEQEIARVALKRFPRDQQQYSPLEGKLESLNVVGAQRLRSLNQELADMLLSDASEAPERLGGEDSALYEDLKWASELKRALDDGLAETLKQLQMHQRELADLPDTGILGTLRLELAEELELLEQRLSRDDFYRHSTEFNTTLTAIRTGVRDAVRQLAEQQQKLADGGIEDLQRLPDWAELTDIERSNVRTTLEGYLIESPAENLQGLKRLWAGDYALNNAIREQKRKIAQTAEGRRLKRREEEIQQAKKAGDGAVSVFTASVQIPARVTSLRQLEDVLTRLQALKADMPGYGQIDVVIELQE
ncbi:BREX system P-loop protein BrxC [Leptolyngbya sp. BC1307]|uniref:BREX system P-loop protein BrxC n=1 Tax=Leptolyngbya sp. BC1307 TaxID=2029589 RepID=UPI000EFA32AF|nr:BREX system P-loop protein BrxC [Leptolyngbya sp. BC1307]